MMDIIKNYFITQFYPVIFVLYYLGAYLTDT